MKIVASLLISFMLLQAESFALVGGPNYSGGGFPGSIVGTYAGTLFPSALPEDLEDADSVIAAASGNSIGIFVFGVPENGAATGSVFIFQEGSSYQGGIVAVADSGRGTITGVLSAIRVSSAVGNLLIYDGRASGGIGMEVFTPNSGNFNSAFGARIRGQSTIEIQEFDIFGDPINVGTQTYFIDGVQQSTQFQDVTVDFLAALGLNGGGN